jgi:hypothetical protein
LALPLEAENTCNRRHISPRIFREHQHADVFSPSPPPSPSPTLGVTNSAVGDVSSKSSSEVFSPSPGEAPGEREGKGEEEVGEGLEERDDVGEEGGGGVFRVGVGGEGDSMC